MVEVMSRMNRKWRIKWKQCWSMVEKYENFPKSTPKRLLKITGFVQKFCHFTLKLYKCLIIFLFFSKVFLVDSLNSFYISNLVSFVKFSTPHFLLKPSNTISPFNSQKPFNFHITFKHWNKLSHFVICYHSAKNAKAQLWTRKNVENNFHIYNKQFSNWCLHTSTCMYFMCLLEREKEKISHLIPTQCEHFFRLYCYVNCQVRWLI